MNNSIGMLLLILTFFTRTAQPCLAQDSQTLIDLGGIWRFNQTANQDGVAWQEAAFDDSRWPQGAGLLYSESNPLVSPRNTLLRLGRTTYYFRKAFHFDGFAESALAVFSSRIDDGAVFYLNGVEIQRIRMPSAPNPISYNTLATDYPPFADLDASDDEVFSFKLHELQMLRIGENVLAVEIHQVSPTSSDVAFGCSLKLIPPNTITNVIHIDPRATYLHTVEDAAPASRGINLANYHIEPGDFIHLRARGDFNWDTISRPAGEATNMIGIFSRNAVVLGSEMLKRIPGSIEISRSVFTQPTWIRPEQTDIPGDFVIDDKIILVPEGAVFLFVSAHDRLYQDNGDLDADYELELSIAHPAPPMLGFGEGSELTLQGSLRTNCRIELTDSLFEDKWVTLTNIAQTVSPIRFVDPTPRSDNKQRFYRARLQ